MVGCACGAGAGPLPKENGPAPREEKEYLSPLTSASPVGHHQLGMEGPWSVSLGVGSWGEGGEQGPSENSWPAFQSPDKANGPSSFSD